MVGATVWSCIPEMDRLRWTKASSWHPLALPWSNAVGEDSEAQHRASNAALSVCCVFRGGPDAVGGCDRRRGCEIKDPRRETIRGQVWARVFRQIHSRMKECKKSVGKLANFDMFIRLKTGGK